MISCGGAPSTAELQQAETEDRPPEISWFKVGTVSKSICFLTIKHEFTVVRIHFGTALPISHIAYTLMFTFTQNTDDPQPASPKVLLLLTASPEPATARLRQPRLVSTDPRPDIHAMLDATIGV